ncbi:MAG: pyridoxal phosphate-dependent aminotransferase [Deltaproteobacteria bacterium]|nr:pyridoxal phosphate-dependent aminotransferase [Deltaproteobacteria bacterium]
MIPSINKIEQSYRDLVAIGQSPIKLYSGNPNEHGFHFPPKILEKVYSRYFEEQGYEPHPKGLLEARQAIMTYYEKQNARVSSENIILTSGTSESFFYLFSILTKPGDNVLCPVPAYPLFDSIAQLTGTRLRHYSLREDASWSIDLKDLREKTDDRTRAILLISPNNPTGAVISAEEIQEIVDWANQKNIPLICDEVFSEFYFGKTFPRPMSLAAPRLCFTLNGISKMFALPGLKLSWIAVTGEEALVDAVLDSLETRADTFLSCHIPIQKALPHLFVEGEAFLKEYRDEVKRRRNLAVALLTQSPDIRCVSPQGGFYLTAEVTKKLPQAEEEFVIQLMREKGVFVHPGYFYDYERGTHLIISFLTGEAQLTESLRALTQFVAAF